jgi:hypothetical protein
MAAGHPSQNLSSVQKVAGLGFDRGFILGGK